MEWKFGGKGGQVDFTSETVTGTSGHVDKPAFLVIAS